MKLAIFGYGKMGKTIERLATGKGHEVVFKAGRELEEGALSEADVAIEFSVPEAAVENISRCFSEGIGVVSGTTGWLDRYEEVLKLCEDSNGSFIYASNFSIGVNVFFALNEYLAKLFDGRRDYGVHISEIHHTEKKDAPSGTAISLAEGIIENSHLKGWALDQAKDDEIVIDARRIGKVKGTHEVGYVSQIDTLSIKHEAHSREGFALGAILAAEWLQHKKGVYSMKEVLGIKT